MLFMIVWDSRDRIGCATRTTSILLSSFCWSWIYILNLQIYSCFQFKAETLFFFFSWAPSHLKAKLGVSEKSELILTEFDKGRKSIHDGKICYNSYLWEMVCSQ
jgi:hypothetical protein